MGAHVSAANADLSEDSLFFNLPRTGDFFFLAEAPFPPRFKTPQWDTGVAMTLHCLIINIHARSLECSSCFLTPMTAFYAVILS